MKQSRAARVGAAVVACGAVVIGGAACSPPANFNASVVGKPASDAPELPTCTASQVADTKDTAATYSNELISSQHLKTGWDGKKKLAEVPDSVKAATKAVMLPCMPRIHLDDVSKNPDNVQNIQKVLSQELWERLVIPGKVGAGNQPEAPKVTGFADPAESYRAFLNAAARMPYFCGEKGEWATQSEACRRELATFFSHAIQETGEKPVPPGEEFWQTSLFQTREGLCWPTKCSDYDGGKEKFEAPRGVSYYGRGIKQLSWAYNYAAFSASYYGDMDVLINNPDLVATDPNLILGSGIWFAMQPQPTKPSMHDVVTGVFKPTAMPKSGEFLGVSQAADGSIVNKFAATVSIINGSYECSPNSGKPEDIALHIQQSKNRFDNYKALLPLLGVPVDKQTANELEIVPGETYCLIANGNPWSVADKSGAVPLAWRTPFYLEMGDPAKGVPGTCNAVGYGQAVPLLISTPGSAQVCETKFQKGVKAPSASTSAESGERSTTPKAVDPGKGETNTVSRSGDVSVSIKRQGDGWGNGYCAQVWATSVQGAPVTDWSIDFNLADGASVNGDGWDSKLTASGSTYTFSPTAWSKKIPPGTTQSGGGFCVEGTRELPSDVVIDDSH